MNKFKLSFLALSKSKDIIIESKSDITNLVGEFIMLFSNDIDYKKLKININPLQQNTHELRERIRTFVQKYKGYNPKVNQFSSYFKNLNENEYFFFLPNIKILDEDSVQYYNYLLALRDDKDYVVLNEQMTDLFGALRNQYKIFAFSEETKNKIGEADKAKRICRFCKKGNEEVTFKKNAHSISEALGNKRIITYDECDSCNEKFGSGIENDLISYLDLYRNFFGIKGKNGVPKLKGKNFEIINPQNGQIEIKYFLNESEMNNPIEIDQNLRLETNTAINFQNIYRTLSKYALSVIDQQFLVGFENTINWINSEKSFKKLPKIALLTSYDMFTAHPKLAVYIRKNNNYNLPFAIGEFRFTFITLVYIIPASSNDNSDFTTQQEYNQFWTFFKHYSSLKDWQFKPMDNDSPKKYIINLNFKIKNKE